MLKSPPHKSKSIARWGKQIGFTLYEMAIGIAVASIAGTIAVKALKTADQVAVAQSYGTALTPVVTTVGTYAANYWYNLQNNTPITLSDNSTIANIYAPTISELKKLQTSPLASWYNSSNVMNASPVVSLSLTPSGCSATPATCDVQGFVYWSKPFTNADGSANIARAQQAASQIPSGGFSSNQSPGAVTATDQSWSTNNPLNLAGTVGGFFSLASSGNALYVKQGDNRAITLRSDLSVSGNQTVTGNITAAGGNVKLHSGAAGGTINLYDSVAGSTVTLAPWNGSVKITSGTATVAQMSPSALIATGAIQTSLNPVAGNTCPTTGQIATDASGNILSCQGGSWVQSAGSGTVDTNTGLPINICTSGAQTISFKRVGGTVYGRGGAGTGWDSGWQIPPFLYLGGALQVKASTGSIYVLCDVGSGSCGCNTYVP